MGELGLALGVGRVCIGGWGVSPAGPPVTGKSFRVVPCVRTCVRAVLGLVRFQPNLASCSFPFHPGGISALFPWEIRCSLSLEINEINGI